MKKILYAIIFIFIGVLIGVQLASRLFSRVYTGVILNEIDAIYFLKKENKFVDEVDIKKAECYKIVLDDKSSVENIILKKSDGFKDLDSVFYLWVLQSIKEESKKTIESSKYSQK